MKRMTCILLAVALCFALAAPAWAAEADGLALIAERENYAGIIAETVNGQIEEARRAAEEARRAAERAERERRMSSDSARAPASGSTRESDASSSFDHDPQAGLVIEGDDIYSGAVYLGVCEVTAYCACSICCGKSDGITATGTTATQGRTVAVDPSVIPYGSVVIINGHEYIAEDCGGGIGGTQIDMFFDSHQDALNWGRRWLDVWVREV